MTENNFKLTYICAEANKNGGQFVRGKDSAK